ncbi:MAG TPA: hypothetical protein VGU72_24360 [Beijerinckiaceae bacterium]|jgi:3-hydroxyanthranilate 3,4-dioxygenase|nr:hypothetical protein [Beijerinckiaceae bacterium]
MNQAITQRVTTRRKNSFNLFREAAKLASFDEFPMLRPEVDPQLTLSSNFVDQPFFLVCEKDSVIAQASGRAQVVFHEGPVRYFDLVPGDFVYVPGGTAHRILTKEPGNQLRYKAREPGLETVVWYCDSCSHEMDRQSWNASDQASQAGYAAACERHNGETARRTCSHCGHAHAAVDLSAFRWPAIAAALALGDDA